MGEILFRAKRIDNGEWAEGYYAVKGKGTDLEKHFIVLSTFDSNTNAYPFYFTDIEVDPETVCQYTGLNDKNGRKIFEGDILRFEDCSNYPVVWDSDYCAFGSCWYSDFDHLSKYRSIKIEVVGNIFDNPELL